MPPCLGCDARRRRAPPAGRAELEGGQCADIGQALRPPTAARAPGVPEEKVFCGRVVPEVAGREPEPGVDGLANPRAHAELGALVVAQVLVGQAGCGCVGAANGAGWDWSWRCWRWQSPTHGPALAPGVLESPLEAPEGGAKPTRPRQGPGERVRGGRQRRPSRRRHRAGRGPCGRRGPATRRHKAGTAERLSLEPKWFEPKWHKGWTRTFKGRTNLALPIFSSSTLSDREGIVDCGATTSAAPDMAGSDQGRVQA